MISRRTFLRASLAWPLAAPFGDAGPLLRVSTQGIKDQQREDVLTRGRPSTVESLADAVVVKRENLFFLAKPDGNVPLECRHGYGLYYHDCRYLNGYELQLAGMAAVDLSATSDQGSIGVFTLTNPPITMPDGGTLDKEEIGVTWQRVIDHETPALRDRLTFRSFTLQPVELSMSLIFSSAFEDVFAVRGLLSKRFGHLHEPVWQDQRLVFRYEGKDGVYRSLTVACAPFPQKTHGATAEFRIGLQ